MSTGNPQTGKKPPPKNDKPPVSITPMKRVQSSVDLTQSDLAGSVVELGLDQLDFYDRNPRKTEFNASFLEIKEWIRVNGSLALAGLHATKRPDASRYMIAGGGNTRLRAIKELYEETGDDKYARVKVIFIPFISEDVLLASSLGENMNRSAMCFWDDATGVMDLKRLIEQELGNTFSPRGFEDYLVKNKYGISVTKSKLYVYMFATERLGALGAAVRLLQIEKVKDLQPQLNRLEKQAIDLGLSEDSFWTDIVNPSLEEVEQDCLKKDSASLDNQAITARCLRAMIEKFPEQAGNFSPQDSQTGSEESSQPVQPNSKDVARTTEPVLKPKSLQDRAKKVVKESFESEKTTTPQDPKKVFLSALSNFTQLCSLEGTGGSLNAQIKAQDQLPFGFYVEAPDLLLASDLSIYEMINRKMFHPSFRDAWWFLVLISGQMNQSVIQQIPEKTAFYKLAMAEDDSWENFVSKMGQAIDLEKFLMPLLFNGQEALSKATFELLLASRQWVEAEPERFAAIVEELSPIKSAEGASL